jgi:IclR family KDG regulon transcriptional repressor
VDLERGSSATSSLHPACFWLVMVAPTNSLERALVLLETIEQSPTGLTTAESSRLLHIPKSTCSYILIRLERKGYLVRDGDTGRYRIGLTTVALAHGALRDMGLRSLGEPALYKLASDTGLSANIGVLERGRVLLVDRVESSGFVKGIMDVADRPSTNGRCGRNASKASGIRCREERDIGRELRADASAMGKVLLAYLPNPEFQSLIESYDLSRLTAHVSMDDLMREFATIRKQGYASTYGEYEQGICAIAAPIVDTSGAVRAAVSINGYLTEADCKESSELIEMVKAASRDISRRAGFAHDVTPN